MSDSYTEIKYTAPPQSRNEAILAATVDGTQYTDPPQSRIEDLLLQVKEKIEQGGGGGTSDYDDLTDKPQINGTTLSGDKSSTDLGLQSTLSFDSVPTDGSTNPVESNGIYDALAGKLSASTKYGSSIEATPIATAQSQKMNLTLKDQDGNALDTTSFDLPIKDITVNTENIGLNLIYQGGLSKLLYINALISGKVDKVQGKGLSTEDFTAMYKAWLDVSMQSPINHNGIFRSKDLTNVYTIDEMYDMIHSGKFDDLFLGDYFTKSITTDIMTRFTGEAFESGTTYYEMGGGTDVTARTWTVTEDATPQSGKTYATKETKTENIMLMFAAFNYYHNNGDTALTTPHVILLPQNAGFATTAKMNSTNTTVGGYLNSDMHQIILPCYAKSLKSALNNHVLSHRTLLSNAINSSTPSMAGAGFTGASSGWEWTTVELQLMTEQQVYGTRAWTSSAYDIGVDYRKLPVFNFINPVQYSRAPFWLRSVVSSMYFAACATYGDATIFSASSASFVRPQIIFG